MILNCSAKIIQPCEGQEYFLSIEDFNEESLAGFLRLRLPSKNHFRPEISDTTALVRELHVYGNMIKIGDKNPKIGQHTGFGERLLKEAERLLQSITEKMKSQSSAELEPEITTVNSAMKRSDHT